MLFNKDRKFATTGAGRKLELTPRPRLKLREEQDREWEKHKKTPRSRFAVLVTDENGDTSYVQAIGAERLGRPARDQESEPETRWSKVDSPKAWAGHFGVSARTFTRWIKAGKIRVKVIDPKNIMVDLRDMPTLKR